MLKKPWPRLPPCKNGEVPRRRLRRTGKPVPLLGLACGGEPRRDVARKAATALQIGYRHFVCDESLDTQHGVGEAVAEWLRGSGNSRDDLFLAASLPNSEWHDPEAAAHRSVEALRAGHIDGYYLEWPAARGADGAWQPYSPDALFKVWTEMRKLVTAEGEKSPWIEWTQQRSPVRHVGVAHIGNAKLNVILRSYAFPPDLYMYETHPLLQISSTAERVAGFEMFPVACAPFGVPPAVDALQSPTVVAASEALRVSPEEVCIRFAIGRLSVALPPLARADADSLEEWFEAGSRGQQSAMPTEQLKAMRSADKGLRGLSGDFIPAGSGRWLEDLWA
eukprot:TRINITY_DN4895_c0_g1_i1.p1 TRINITY_DN4895_c0_g1~~TRINITY_DN4895_c0_g1_i1.p1  ORF type:complete len:335 (+),score=78.97 TRINITY_DN4895_c0_g1_i1:71-1075(+)